MLGIENIGSYIPEKRESNFAKMEKFEIDEKFITGKIGVEKLSIKEKAEKSSSLCVKAFENLCDKHPIEKSEIDCCIVVTQNPDYPIPHVSAIVHKELSLGKECACFDISLGCSGYVYGLSVILSFMKDNGFTKGLLFTSDPYSDIINKDDKNTDLLFGDGATVTLIGEKSLYAPIGFSFATDGSGYENIICKDGILDMNGRGVFNFAATTIPRHIKEFMKKRDLQDDDIDMYILHQGSKFIVDTIVKRLKIDSKKAPFDMLGYGNTISSSIPIILEKYLGKGYDKILLSGYGVGLSWATTVLEKIKER